MLKGIRRSKFTYEYTQSSHKIKRPTLYPTLPRDPCLRDAALRLRDAALK